MVVVYGGGGVVAASKCAWKAMAKAGAGRTRLRTANAQGGRPLAWVVFSHQERTAVACSCGVPPAWAFRTTVAAEITWVVLSPAGTVIGLVGRPVTAAGSWGVLIAARQPNSLHWSQVNDRRSHRGARSVSGSAPGGCCVVMPGHQR